MQRTYLVLGMVVMILLAAAIPALADTCPAEGSGAAGVAEYAANCTDCTSDGPVATCNNEFTIELLGIDRDLVLGLVTYTYELYKPLPGPTDELRPDLYYWVLGANLEEFQHCLADDKTLSDLFVECTVNSFAPDVDCGLVIPDPKTQLSGVKFQGKISDGISKEFSVTLDENALAPGFEIVDDCVVAATKAEGEDIQRAGNSVPGYACVVGPVCVGEPLQFICPRSQGYWKNHLDAWPVETITLGVEVYTKEEARAIMRTPTRGDASIILARQLIAAKLNIENGANPDPATETIDAADAFLATFPGRLPLGVRTYTANGKQMLEYAKVLDAYNNGYLTPNCFE